MGQSFGTYDPNWKAGKPVEMTDAWTGNTYTVFPSAPPETYPRGYFGDTLSAHLPFFSQAEQLRHWQWQEELCLHNQQRLAAEHRRNTKKSAFLKMVEREESEQQLAHIRAKIAEIQTFIQSAEEACQQKRQHPL